MSTAERFEHFHADNPIIYSTLETLVQEWVKDQGKTKLGIRMLWETARWRIIRSTRNADFKMNDHYTSYYVRLLVLNHLDWIDMFELRRSPADDWMLGKISELEHRIHQSAAT